MSYEFYKVIHLVSLILVASCLGISFFAQSQSKWPRIVGMTASFLLLVGGMGLLAKFQSHTLPWPLWVKIKLALWFVIAVAGPIMAKRLKTSRTQAFFGIISILAIGVYLAVIKPS